MKKEVKRVLIIGLSVIFVAICLIGFVISQSWKSKSENLKNEAQNIKFFREYPDVVESNKFEYITVEQVLDIITKGSGIIYFGFPACPWCQAYVPVLDEVSREQGLDKVYYYNPKDIRANNTEEYKKITTILGEYLDSDKDGNKRLYVPHVFVIKDGKVIGENNDMSTMSGDAKKYFTEEKRAELKTKLIEIISKYSDSCKDNIESKGC